MCVCVAMCSLPEGHLEDLSQVDLLSLVAVAVQHLAEQGVVEADALPRALGPLAVVSLQEAGASVMSQPVLLHTPEEEEEEEEEKALSMMHRLCSIETPRPSSLRDTNLCEEEPGRREDGSWGSDGTSAR